MPRPYILVLRLKNECQIHDQQPRKLQVTLGYQFYEMKFFVGGRALAQQDAKFGPSVLLFYQYFPLSHDSVPMYLFHLDRVECWRGGGVSCSCVQVG